MPGSLIMANTSYNHPKMSLMYMNGMLYLRSESIKPAPFVMINPSTFEEVKFPEELNFEPKEGETRSL
jgi:hypothetical protein